MNDGLFDALVGDFYRAATGAIEWEDALGAVRLAFGARAATMHSVDMSGRLLGIRGSGPDLAEATLQYVRGYHALDPRLARARQLGVHALGRWQHCHETFDDDFVARDRFYQDFLAAHGSRYNASVTLLATDREVTGFALQLPAARGPLNADERGIARRLGEHMREALQASQRTRALMQKALAGHNLLKGFPYPMWLVDEDSVIVFENDPAIAERQTEVRIAQRADRLTLKRDHPARRLAERLGRLRQAGHSAREIVDLRATDADAPAWLHLSLLVPGAVLGAFGERPLILATLFDPSQVSALDTFALGNMFGLTPAEAKVAARMADGLTAERIGEAHGTTTATVRTQVKQVLAKLGVNRSADVVRMLRQGEALWSTVSSANDHYRGPRCGGGASIK